MHKFYEPVPPSKNPWTLKEGIIFILGCAAILAFWGLVFELLGKVLYDDYDDYYEDGYNEGYETGYAEAKEEFYIPPEESERIESYAYYAGYYDAEHGHEYGACENDLEKEYPVPRLNYFHK